MSRVLIWKRVAPGSENAIFTPTDYDHLYTLAINNWGGACPNWGNKLWIQGIYSEIDTGENTYGFLPEVIDADQINQEYDFIIFPMANIFNQDYLHMIRATADHLEKIRIPVYIIACGAQADRYEDLPDLVDAIGDESKRFIKAVYNTGGEFALRGYFTKEFFDRLGFPSAVVTGCPSLYQLGRDFRVAEDKCNVCDLYPVFNGRISQFSKLMQVFPESAFMDQDQLFFALLKPDYLEQTDFRFQANFAKMYGLDTPELISQGRIVMATDMDDWLGYLKERGFNYAFGSRIHGTIMALLSGIPATIAACDTRTREMAEFFDIPQTVAESRYKPNEDVLYKAYEQMDYNPFNRTFSEKFDAFEQFLKKHGIVSHINCDNRFFTNKKPEVITASPERRAQFSQLAERMERNRAAIELANLARNVLGRIR